MHPSREDLEASEQAGAQLHDGLEVGDNLVTFERSAQIDRVVVGHAKRRYYAATAGLTVYFFCLRTEVRLGQFVGHVGGKATVVAMAAGVTAISRKSSGGQGGVNECRVTDVAAGSMILTLDGLAIEARACGL
jgi:hypothetical protein